MSWGPGELRDLEIGTRRKVPGKKAHMWSFAKKKIPAPYDRIVCQLKAEAEHGDSDKSHEAQRRQTYARIILDAFAKELKAYNRPTADFRSHVLSPILVRQLMGIPDSYSPSIEAAVSNNDREVTIGMATDLYLSRDPTAVELIPGYRYNAILLPEVRWHLAVVLEKIRVGDPDEYNLVLGNQDVLAASYGHHEQEPEAEGDEPPDLCIPMISVLIKEDLEDFFAPELKEVARVPLFAVLVARLTATTQPDLWRDARKMNHPEKEKPSSRATTPRSPLPSSRATTPPPTPTPADVQPPPPAAQPQPPTIPSDQGQSSKRGHPKDAQRASSKKPRGTNSGGEDEDPNRRGNSGGSSKSQDGPGTSEPLRKPVDETIPDTETQSGSTADDTARIDGPTGVGMV